MNRTVLAILVVACLIAGAGAISYYRIAGKRIVTAKPVPAIRSAAGASDINRGAVLPGAGAPTKRIASTTRKAATNSSRRMPFDFAGGQSRTIPQGMHAFTVKVDEIVGVARLVTPGMSLDVLVSSNSPGGDAMQGVVTNTILRDIQVLSSGTYVQNDAEGKPRQLQLVNLLLTPEQAVTLSQAGSQPGILLVLRNPVGGQAYEVPATAIDTLYQDRPPSAMQPVKRTAADRDVSRSSFYAVEVINGSKAGCSKTGESQTGGSKAGGSTTSIVIFPLPEGMQ